MDGHPIEWDPIRRSQRFLSKTSRKFRFSGKWEAVAQFRSDLCGWPTPAAKPGSQLVADLKVQKGGDRGGTAHPGLPRRAPRHAVSRDLPVS